MEVEATDEVIRFVKGDALESMVPQEEYVCQRAACSPIRLFVFFRRIQFKQGGRNTTVTYFDEHLKRVWKAPEGTKDMRSLNQIKST